MIIRTLDELKSAAAQVVALADAVQSAASDQAKLVASANGDSTRSADYKIARLAEIKASSKVPALFAELQARYSELQETRPIWTTPMSVLAKEPLYPASSNKDGSADSRATYAAAEAAIKTNMRAELAAMGQGLAELWALEAAQNRQWAKVFQAALVLPKLPFSLDALPITALEEADAAFYSAEVGLRAAEIASSELAGRKESSLRIALGLLSQEHDRKVAQRRAGVRLSYDERRATGEDERKANDAHLKELDAIPGLSIATLGRPGR